MNNRSKDEMEFIERVGCGGSIRSRFNPLGDDRVDRVNHLKRGVLKQQIAKGDRARIEVDLSELDLSERITKITKIHEGQVLEPTQSLDGVPQ